ncbi:cobyrinate a,c-diamide synthase [Benzoatithermus flavus]|uniref:Cobyrinate a,c-diamide synthase n=1 Tax=Benzoatithermus flavus TaxID=3108223 RepID=A0ABU8XM89_9PROT
MSAPVVIVAAPASGAGKTVLTLGILRALRRRGLRVGSFKVGPDYIDPAFHAAATGHPAYNIDGWAMRFDTLAALLEDSGRDRDVVIGEGVMGLFDGAADGTGSTADIAALFGLPVVLVVDVTGMGASVAALIDGFRRHREDVEVTGVVFNRVGSEGHADLLSRACFEHLSTPILGSVPRERALSLPSRHLGLVQAVEHPDLETFLEAAADLAEARLDLERILRVARSPSVSLLGPDARPLPPLGQRTAVASDAAFAFAYPAILDGWRRQGIELLPFSPLADETPDAAADAVYLPGGYPELHAARLAGNARFLAGLRAAAARGAFLYGECGGYMVLGRTLVDREGTGHAMAGLLPVTTSFAAPKLHLGYRQAELLSLCPLGVIGAGFRGHEFHFASEVERMGPPLFRTRCARGRDLGEQGCRVGRVAGSFLHLIDRVQAS